MWSIRLAVTIPASAIALVLSFHPRFQAMDQPVAAAVVLINGLITALANSLFGAETAMYFVPGTVVVTMYGYLLMGLRFAWSAPLVGGIVALNLATLWVLNTPTDVMIKALYTLAISTGILTVGAYRMEMTSRTEHYTAELLLSRERHERQSEATRIDWLENLAHFLRHELRNNVTGVRTSLDLLERHTGPNERAEVYFGRARQGIKVIQRLLESAGQASSLESSFIQDPITPLALAPIVKAEVESHQAIHPDLTFELRGKSPPLWILGNRERIILLLQNLLANAVDHHNPGTPIGVSLEYSEHRARLTVENQGPPLPPEGDAIFDLFASFRSQTNAAGKRGFGLYLVRLIAERYGGTALAKNLPGGEGVQFEILLPLSRTPSRPTGPA